MEGSSSSHVVVVDGVVTSIENELKGVHSTSNNCCIYRVPYRFQRGPFRKVKEEAYMPKVVSIGPLHRCKSSENMKEKKKIYLKDFLQRKNVSLEQCVETVENGLETLRSCYEENLSYIKDDELVKIIVVDAVFVIETLLKLFILKDGRMFIPLEDDRMFIPLEDDRMFSPFILPDVMTEFLLLENQLPFFILEDLFQFAQLIDKTLIDCCYEFFKLNGDNFKKNEEYLEKIKVEQYKPKHLIDLMRKFYEPLKRPNAGQHETSVSIPQQDDQGFALIPQHEDVCIPCCATQQDDQEFARIPNATRLHQAGVKLKVRSTKETGTNNLLDICFTKETGTLEIPKLQVDDHTDSVFRNLIAFEQCHNCGNTYLSDYISLLDCIVNTPKDVDLLVEKGIIVNWLGHSDDVSTMINRLGDGLNLDDDKYGFSYDRLCVDVNDYCKTLRHKWKANLKQDYFNTPWAIISFVAAVVLIVLTIIQTVCSVISTIN